MPALDAADLARRLARQAEAVCRCYLPAGRRRGRYWQIGDVRNTPGRSLYVRLHGPDSGRGAAGKWTDAATGEHGDLLDLIGRSLGLTAFRDIAEEARRFLCLPHPEPHPAPRHAAMARGSPEAAQRLFANSRPIIGTIADAYLRSRGITALREAEALRFHPRCYHRAENDTLPSTWPAMIAAVTDHQGELTGVQRTWLRPDGSGKAPVDTPRKALGDLLGHAVRFGTAQDVMAAGEGIETMLALRVVLPTLPVAAALSAAHLSAMLLPATLRRLYIVRDNDPAGRGAAKALADRAEHVGIEAMVLSPQRKDFNDDLVALGPGRLANATRVQIAPEDVARFLQTHPDPSLASTASSAKPSCKVTRHPPV